MREGKAEWEKQIERSKLRGGERYIGRRERERYIKRRGKRGRSTRLIDEKGEKSTER